MIAEGSACRYPPRPESLTVAIDRSIDQTSRPWNTNCRSPVSGHRDRLLLPHCGPRRLTLDLDPRPSGSISGAAMSPGATAGSFTARTYASGTALLAEPDQVTRTAWQRWQGHGPRAGRSTTPRCAPWPRVCGRSTPTIRCAGTSRRRLVGRPHLRRARPRPGAHVLPHVAGVRRGDPPDGRQPRVRALRPGRGTGRPAGRRSWRTRPVPRRTSSNWRRG